MIYRGREAESHLTFAFFAGCRGGLFFAFKAMATGLTARSLSSKAICSVCRCSCAFCGLKMFAPRCRGQASTLQYRQSRKRLNSHLLSVQLLKVPLCPPLLAVTPGEFVKYSYFPGARLGWVPALANLAEIPGYPQSAFPQGVGTLKPFQCVKSFLALEYRLT